MEKVEEEINFVDTNEFVEKEVIFVEQQKEFQEPRSSTVVKPTNDKQV